MAKAIEKKPEASGENKYAQRRWVKPKLRAASYASERKAKIQLFGIEIHRDSRWRDDHRHKSFLGL